MGVVSGVVVSRFRLGSQCRGSKHLHGRVAMLVTDEMMIGEAISDVECFGWQAVVTVRCWTLVGGRTTPGSGRTASGQLFSKDGGGELLVTTGQLVKV